MTDISYQIAKNTQLPWLLHRCRLSRTSLEAGDLCAFISQHRVTFRAMGRVNVSVISKVDVRATKRVNVRVTGKANVRAI